MLGILRHFLNGIGHLVHGGRDLLHLQRLLLALVLSLTGQVAERTRGLFQRAGGFEQLAHHAAHLLDEGVEIAAQSGQFILAGYIQVARQIGIAAGDIGHRLHRLT